ncbi:hypothetical protein [Bacteroides cellulosilyticus]|jgi:hypothetical protein|uniref:hypothetical protein n=1 Tax=Bacteroides cellulosilyticus TaxID=246787 RepID=UPI001E342E17|nr:hypothetical protein [Bacteroides cellulosilyticus]QUT92252.1 hypothetical protein INE78_04268 [Bacteroides cellulosilyticus]DAZ48571.1 MAG TPA: hypothetical protein [Caudoviricetes sp.]
MSKASYIVAGSIIGAYYKEIQLGKITYKIYQPTIKEMCLIFGNNSTSINDNMRRFELIAQMPEHVNECARALSYAVSIRKSELFRKATYQYILHYATMEQIESAFFALANVINGKELFESVKKERVRSEDKPESVGGNSILGTISTLIENLHLSYKEAFETIPYPVMLMMNADKVRVLGLNEKKEIKISGKELAQRRKGGKNG